MPTFPYILYGLYRTRYALEQGLWRSLCGLFVLTVPPSHHMGILATL